MVASLLCFHRGKHTHFEATVISFLSIGFELLHPPKTAAVLLLMLYAAQQSTMRFFKAQGKTLWCSNPVISHAVGSNWTPPSHSHFNPHALQAERLASEKQDDEEKPEFMPQSFDALRKVGQSAQP